MEFKQELPVHIIVIIAVSILLKVLKSIISVRPTILPYVFRTVQHANQILYGISDHWLRRLLIIYVDIA